MPRSSVNYGQLMFVVMALALSQCGHKTKSQDVLISLNPTNPIVILSTLTYNDPGGNPITVQGPWFKFQVLIDNTSDTSVTLESLHIDVTGTDSTGNTNTVSTDFDPATFSYTTQGTNPIICDFNDFGQFDPHGFTSGCADGNPPVPPTGLQVAVCKNNQLPSYNNLSFYMIPEGASSGCNIAAALPLFIAGGNPAPANTASITYSVNVTPIGWFGTRNAQTDRFTNSIFAFTQ